MYFGGANAWCVEDLAPGSKTGEGRPLKTRPYPAEGLTAITSSSHLTEDTRKFLARHRIVSSTGIGSSLKFCRVASGRADVYPRWGRTMEWDTAAGHAVLQAAGGTVLTPEGAPFLYGKGGLGFANGPFVAWGREPL
jgi:3'(2'), 5'-bisphosphate nucleotidase